MKWEKMHRLTAAKPAIIIDTMNRRQMAKLVLILGALTAFNSMSIDMYLPAFPQMSRDLGVPLGTVQLSISAFLFGSAIGQLLYGTNVLAVRLSLPVNSVQELIAYAKANPGKLLYGSPGNGSSLHLSMEIFKSMTDTQMQHVPYKDAQQAVMGVIAGQVDLQFENTGAIIPHVKAGRVRALAISTAQRSPALPELPTVAEAGVAGFEVTTWAGFVGPAGLLKEVVAKLNGELNRALSLPSVIERFAFFGYETAKTTPEQFDALIQKEAARWSSVVKRVGARVD